MQGFLTFSVNLTAFCRLMCQSMPTYLAIGTAKRLISLYAEFQLLWHVTFGRRWWARQDSNSQPDRYERSALTN